MLQPGTSAPTFTLPGVHDGEFDEFDLGEEPGEVVVLAFYPLDFHPACTDAMGSLRDVELFSLKDDVRLYGISVDGVYSHRAYAEQQALGYPLLSDRLGDVAERYDVLREEFEGHPRVADRAVFVIDPHGTIQYATAVEDPYEDLSVDEITKAVEAIQDDRTAIEQYRAAHEYFQYGRSELEAAREAYDEEQWGLAIETFDEAAYYFSEAAAGFRSARRFAEADGIAAAAATASEKATRLRQASTWYRRAARYHGEGAAATADEYHADATEALEAVEELPPIRELRAP